MSGLLTGSSRRALRSPRGAGGLLLVPLLVLSAGCEGATEQVADSLPDLLVHTGYGEHSAIHGIRLADGKVLFSLPGSAAAWSPDGQLISYVEGTGYDSVSHVAFPGPLVLAMATGQRLGVLSEIGGLHSWSPDGTKIAVGYWEDGPFTSAHSSLHVIDSSGGGRHLISQSVTVRFSRPSWSPDSRQFVVGGGAIFNADGSGTTWLEGGGNGSVWSPDGGSIAISVDVYDDWVEFPTSRSEIFVIALPGGELTQLTNTSTPGARIMMSGSPAWSPDGTLIAFRREVVPQSTFPWGHSHLYVMSTDGSNPRRIGFGENVDGVRAPAWSPDGSRIAYGAGEVVRIVNVDGTNDRHVAGGWDPVWRPVVR
jgi:Tol biopolymer transport system component